jgi:hypothetical protein
MGGEKCPVEDVLELSNIIKSIKNDIKVKKQKETWFCCF